MTTLPYSRFDTTGTLLKEVRSKTIDIEMDFKPVGLLLDDFGNLLVASSSKFEFWVFKSDGTFDKIISYHTDLARPRGCLR